MRSVRYHQKGAPEVMAVEEIDVPQPGAGEILMRVEFAGVSYGDVLRRSGGHYPIQTPLPTVPGTEVYGVIEQVGEGVDAGLVGTRAIGTARTGGYAEYAVGPAKSLIPAPDGLAPEVALAGISLGVTATLILTAVGQLAPGHTVWVPAAAGALGSLAVQLAGLYGAGRVYAGVGSREKMDVALQAGAHEAFDYTQEGWSELVKAANGGEGVDLALETVGGPVFYETLEAVKPGGRIVNYGNASDTDSPVNPRVLLRKNLTLSGYMNGPYPEQRKQAYEDVIAFLRSGQLRPQIGGIYPLDEAPEAHRAIENRTSTGKLIIATTR